MVAPPVTNPSSNVRVVDEDSAGLPQPEDVLVMAAPLSRDLTDELDGALHVAAVGLEELLLAALGRAIARTISVGVVTVGGLTAVSPIRLACVLESSLDADGLLAEVRNALAAPPQATPGPADVMFSFLGMAPEPALGPLHLVDGPALSVLAYRCGGVLQMDWWYDARRLDACTVEELADQFRLGLIGLTSEVSPARGVFGCA